MMKTILLSELYTVNLDEFQKISIAYGSRKDLLLWSSSPGMAKFYGPTAAAKVIDDNHLYIKATDTEDDRRAICKDLAPRLAKRKGLTGDAWIGDPPTAA